MVYQRSVNRVVRQGVAVELYPMPAMLNKQADINNFNFDLGVQDNDS